MARKLITSNQFDYATNCTRAYTEFCRKANLKTVTAKTQKLNMKKFYLENHPNDEEGMYLDPTASFFDLMCCLQYRQDPYKEFNISSSDIRECLFVKLVELMGIEYDTLYYTWLGASGY